jgi:hypothetical protein
MAFNTLRLPNRAKSTLNGAHNSSVTTISLADASGFPTGGGYIKITEYNGQGVLARLHRLMTTGC